MAKSHIKLWFILMFLAIIAVPALLSPEAARSRLQAEYESSARIFGQKKVVELTDSATSLYDTVIGGSGIEDFIKVGYVKREDTKGMVIGKQANEDMSTITNRYLQSMLLQIYGVFFRGCLMIHWLIYVGFFLVAAIVDGVQQRNIKNDMLQMNAPVKFAVSFHVLIFIVFTPMAYLLLPWAVTPWFMPIWSLLIALPMAKAISNAVKTG